MRTKIGKKLKELQDVDYDLNIYIENQDEEDDDNETNYRDKDKERINLEIITKKKLSKETIKAINDNEKEIDEIIEELQKRGVIKDGKGVDLAKFKNKKVQQQRSL